MSRNTKDILIGSRAIFEAFRAGTNIDKIILRKGAKSDWVEEVLEKAQKRNIPVQRVPLEAIERLSKGGNHQGIIAHIAAIKYLDLENLLEKASPKPQIYVLLDQVSDVRNVGAIARTAECMGANALIIPEQGSARINAQALKSAAGALQHLPVVRTKSLVDAVFLLQQYGIQVIACHEKAAKPIYELDLRQPIALLFGSEEKGIGNRLIKLSDQAAKIPLQGKISSLNVSVAVGMILGEASRQRHHNKA